MANTNSSNPTDYRGYTAIAIGCTVGLAVAIAGIADSLGFIDLNPTEERAQSQEVSLSPITQDKYNVVKPGDKKSL